MIAQVPWDPQTKEKPRAPFPIRNSISSARRKETEIKEIHSTFSDHRVSFTLRLDPFVSLDTGKTIHSPFPITISAPLFAKQYDTLPRFQPSSSFLHL